mmetsp:Transcript_96787/g.166880  ORF Transcript_96787/g.166880 Transcript_96787/m.166880 type:complete len:145 (-) Transcript_96787:1619-2053(-)
MYLSQMCRKDRCQISTTGQSNGIYRVVGVQIEGTINTFRSQMFKKLFVQEGADTIFFNFFDRDNGRRHTKKKHTKTLNTRTHASTHTDTQTHAHTVKGSGYRFVSAVCLNLTDRFHECHTMHIQASQIMWIQQNAHTHTHTQTR